MKAEDLLKQSGDSGPAQLCLLSLFSLVNLLSAFHYFAQTFIFLVDPAGNKTEIELQFNDTSKFHTMPDEMGWTEEEAWKTALIQSMFFVGSVFGTLTLGILADHMGRIPALIAANLFAVTGNLLTVYVGSSVSCLSFSRFVAGLATDTNFFMMYIIVMEYIRPEFRTLGLNLCIGVWYCVGCMVTPWIAARSGNWRTFLLVVSLPMTIIPVCCWFVPESAQWLVSRGDTEKAIECFKKIAAFNGKKLSPEFVNQFKTAAALQSDENNKNGNLLGLFKTPHLRKKSFILIFKTMVLTLCYDAMSRNITGFNADPFILFTITSASILPSCLVILIFQDRIGRKAIAVFSLLLTGIFNFAQGGLQLLTRDGAYVGAAIGLLGRFAVNIAYNSGTQYAAELIPTQVRGQGLAVIHVVGYFAAFFSPYILYSSVEWIAAPETILTLLSFAGAGFCLLLPETLDKALPATLEDGEAFGKDEKPWDFLRKNMELSYSVTSRMKN